MASSPSVGLGIHVGSSFCAVASSSGERIEVVANEAGSRTTPALVLFDPSNSEWLVGEAAVTKAPKLAASTDPPSATKVNSLLIQKLRTVAEGYAGQRASTAVLTVPVSASDKHKEVIVAAAGKAGLKSVSLLDTASAALIAFDFDVPKQQREKVLVFDFGGTGLEVTVADVVDGTFSFLGSVRDTTINGALFDDAIVDFCKVQFQRKYRCEVEGRRALTRLRTACQEAKHSLTRAARVSVELDSLFDGLDLNVPLTRPRFEDLAFKLFKTITQPVEAALTAAGVSVDAIDKVVLTGGASNMPRVRRTLESFFTHGPTILMKGTPEETAANGAAIEATTRLAAVGAGGDAADAAPTAAPHVEFGVLPRSLGLAAADGALITLLHANTVLPASATHICDCPPGVDSVSVNLYQGEEFIAADNRFVGQLSVPIPSEGAGRLEVVVVALPDGDLVLQAHSLGADSKTVELRLSAGQEVVEPLIPEREESSAVTGAGAGAGGAASTPTPTPSSTAAPAPAPAPAAASSGESSAAVQAALAAAKAAAAKAAAAGVVASIGEVEADDLD